MMGPLPNSDRLIEALRFKAEQLGLELFGITTLDTPPHLPTYEAWIAQGRHAGMAYMASERNRFLRTHPQAILPEARALVVVGMRYPAPQALPPPASRLVGRIASYAWGKDYHLILPVLLQELLKVVEEFFGHPIPSRLYSDTGPVLERDFAQQAGLGWIGKNTCLIHPRKGSYFLLGEAFIGVSLPSTPAFSTDYCGTCRRCIEACPTQCILPDRTIDAGQCISYLTIENKGAIPRALRPHMGNWVFGCDICQMVCPWNLRFARAEGSTAFTMRPEIAFPDLTHELQLTPKAFKERYGDTPVMRARRRGFLRNLAVALGNAADPSTVPTLAQVLREEPEPLIRSHAAWALGRIQTHAARLALEKAYKNEPTPEVQMEINAALEQIP
ncbi:tRNA epoxyqueuosine(34) reductase QueG [uncultured Thermanaerothrix sp.]|uniref:tRNA epoxyqueuosine(34) reductase QueG n=1 Tax=uncultured Thermanaerothrix sp. TaxID=1195149 RepID=UPI00262277E7|nr:tRNA epoxyqueuosine(34) reductase QueG [uncultured Thermanaerothrix sp.]